MTNPTDPTYFKTRSVEEWKASRRDTPEDVEAIISATKDVVGYLRSFSPVWRDLQSGKTPFIL